MRVRKALYFAILAFLILAISTTDAKRRSDSSRSRSRSSSSGSHNHYTGVVIIAGPNGSYYNGYGNMCPHGCAVEGRCGTRQECYVDNPARRWIGNAILIFIAVVGLIWCISCICSKDESSDDDESYHRSGSYHSSRSSRHSRRSR